MIIKDAKLALRELGMVLNYDPSSREFRVNFKGGTEATAYYTNDLEDAVGTGRHMGQQRQTQGSRLAGGDRRDALIEVLAKKYHVNFMQVRKLMLKHLDDVEKVEKDLASMNKVNRPEADCKASSMNRFSASQTVDRVSDQLERLGEEIPREASNLRGLALRLDRVANTLEAEQEATERVSNIENELEDLGVDFTVAPNSEGRQATCIYAYKGQLNSHDEASVIGRIAKKHGSLFENMRNNRTYKITVPHHV